MSEIPKQRSEGGLMPYTFEYSDNDPAGETRVVIHMGSQPSGRDFINTLYYFVPEDGSERRLNYLTNLIDAANQKGKLANQLFDLDGFTSETANAVVETRRSIRFGAEPTILDVKAVIRDAYGDENMQFGMAKFAERLVDTGSLEPNIVIAMDDLIIPHNDDEVAQELQRLTDQYGLGM